MNSKREAKKILKAYGKAAYQERVKYVDSFSEEKAAFLRKISYRRVMKRCMLVALILILTFSLLVIGANALGIKFLNLSIFETDTHSEITGNRGNKTADAGEVKFYKPDYIPKGYSLVEEDGIEDIKMTYIYKNNKDEYLYINESVEDKFSHQIDNEDCEISTETILDMEVRVYRYKEPANSCIYIMKKGNLYIEISGNLKDDEMKKIIYSLK